MDTPASHEQNADQVTYWNGPAGQRWDRQAAQDIVLGPVADFVIDRSKLMPGERVIDVGCGSGAAFAPRKQKAVAPKLEERRRTVQARDRSPAPRSLVLQLCGVGVVAG